MPHISEYDVETKFIDRLESIGYNYVDLKDYSCVIENFRKQLATFNASKLMEAKGETVFSDAEFDRVMIHLDNHSVYESAKLLRDKFILSLDNGKTVYLEFFPLILNEIFIRYPIRSRWIRHIRTMLYIKTDMM